jgi:hypothetical protein
VGRAAGLARRVRRFLSAIDARPRSGIVASATANLTPQQLTLFHRMHPADQAHCLRLRAELLCAGHGDPDLITAALLHDCGKAWPSPRLWLRVLVDVGESIAPAGLDWLCTRRFWLGWIARAYRLHGALGARAARLAGCSPRVVALIAECGGHTRAVDGHRGSRLAVCLTPDPVADILRRFDSAL